MNKQAIGLFIAGIVIGGAGAWLLHPKTPGLVGEREEKIRLFVDQDVRRYADAHTADDKLAAANQMYQRAVALFVAELAVPVQGLPPEASALSARDIGVDAPPVDEGDPAAGN
jgi:hypothetical protein